MSGERRGTAVGVLPALGSGLTDLRRMGQHERLLDYDLAHYARAFEEVHYFSYFDERLEEFTQAPILRARVRVHPNRPRLAGWPYAVWLPWRHRRPLSRCRVKPCSSCAAVSSPASIRSSPSNFLERMNFYS